MVKVAGTEKGVTEPKATFSTCFGAPFLPLAPSRYARMLGEKIARHPSRVRLRHTTQTAAAREHRVDRRSVRRRQADEDRLYAGDDSRGALGRARSRRVRKGSGLQSR